MREKLVGLLAAALMCVCGVASANITYTVDLSGGGETVTGTITTDGDSAALTLDDFLSWSLTATGTFTFTLDPSAPQSLVTCGAACGIDATASSLSFAGTVGDGMSFSSGDGAIAFTPGGFVVTDPDSNAILIPVDASTYTIGLVSVPEPPTAPLLGLGLACLGLACTRTRARQSPAV